MISRKMYRAQYKDGYDVEILAQLKQMEEQIKRYLANDDIFTISLYQWQNNLFLYFECGEIDIHPSEIFTQLKYMLEDWPGELKMRKWIPLIDVFHFNEPRGLDHWSRKQPIEKCIGKVARLVPEKVSSYIYYHYQLQEEQAFYGEKYKLIGMHENLLFMYDEIPATTEQPIHTGKLSTKGTPENWEETRMDLHFIPWEDGVKFFREINQLFSL